MRYNSEEAEIDTVIIKMLQLTAYVDDRHYTVKKSYHNIDKWYRTEATECQPREELKILHG